jgi:predicted DsbA family dithiol-disulfide isomerase
VIEALFAAYFTDGVDLARRESLLEIAAAAGLDPEATERYLAGDAGKDAVEESQQAAQAMRITGVPFTLLSGPGGQFALSGAMPVGAFVDALDRASGSGTGKGDTAT